MRMETSIKDQEKTVAEIDNIRVKSSLVVEDWLLEGTHSCAIGQDA